MKQDPLAEGWAEYELERAEREALDTIAHWTREIADPCCPDCGWLTYARGELRAALKRALGLLDVDVDPLRFGEELARMTRARRTGA